MLAGVVASARGAEQLSVGQLEQKLDASLKKVAVSPAGAILRITVAVDSNPRGPGVTCDAGNRILAGEYRWPGAGLSSSKHRKHACLGQRLQAADGCSTAGRAGDDAEQDDLYEISPVWVDHVDGAAGSRR